MKKVEHPNVLGLLGVCLNTEDGLPYIVLPFMENGDLKTFLHSKRTTVGSNLKYPEVNIFSLKFGKMYYYNNTTVTLFNYVAIYTI